MIFSQGDLDRFWSKVSKTDEHWLWTAAVFKNGGYGAFSLGGRPVRAHRASWVIHNGPIPSGLDVLHVCDITSCVMPDDLFLGTQADNMADMARKGRSPSGDRNHMTKITEQDVIEIMSLKGSATCYVVADLYGISFGYVARIWRGEERRLVRCDEE